MSRHPILDALPDASSHPRRGGVGVLLVCTANVSRSPFAELLLRARTDEWVDSTGRRVVVWSRGVDAREGARMDPLMARRLPRDVPGAEAHRSHRMTPDDLETADLIVALDRSHVQRIARALPSASGRVVTLLRLGAVAREACARPELASLDLRSRILLLLELRAAVPKARREDAYDVADPMGRGALSHRRAAKAVSTAVASLAAALTRS